MWLNSYNYDFFIQFFNLFSHYLRFCNNLEFFVSLTWVTWLLFSDFYLLSHNSEFSSHYWPLFNHVDFSTHSYDFLCNYWLWLVCLITLTCQLMILSLFWDKIWNFSDKCRILCLIKMTLKEESNFWLLFCNFNFFTDLLSHNFYNLNLITIIFSSFFSYLLLLFFFTWLQY